MVTLQTSSLWLEAPNKRTGDTQKNLSDFQAQTHVLSCALAQLLGCFLTPQLCMELSSCGLIQKLLFFQAVKD